MRKKLNKQERQAVYSKTDGHCAYCGCEIALNDMQADHIHSLRKGGEDTINNLLPACRSCNHYKSTLDIEQFRAALQRMPEVLRRDNTTYKIAERFGIIASADKPVKFYFER